MTTRRRDSRFKCRSRRLTGAVAALGTLLALAAGLPAAAAAEAPPMAHWDLEPGLP